MNVLRSTVVVCLGVCWGVGFGRAAEEPALAALAMAATNEVAAPRTAETPPATSVTPTTGVATEDEEVRKEFLRDERTARGPSRNEPSGSARTSTVTDFSQFRLILERNIFDPTRRKPLPPGSRREERPPPVRPETLTLTGAICYGGKTFAFFDGSDPGWRGVFSPGEKLGGWTLAKVGTDGVRLEGGEKPLKLPVGRSLRRRGEEPWEITEAVASTAGLSPMTGFRPSGPDLPSASGSGASTSGAAGAGQSSGRGGGVPAGLSDIMKRMMERRKQQENQ